MKKQPFEAVRNQHGSVINVALLILILIFLIGIGLNKISTTDIKIATNIKTATETFYETEAALEGASDLVEENVACTVGFAATGYGDTVADGRRLIDGTIMVTNLTFWRNQNAKPIETHDVDPTDPTDPNYDEIAAYYPPDYDPNTDPDAEHTLLSIGGPTRFSTGSAIQMAAGYEGLGKGAGAGGASIIYDIYAIRQGGENTSGVHYIQWIHKLGLGGTCKYD